MARKAKAIVKFTKAKEEKHIGGEPDIGSEVTNMMSALRHYSYFYNLKDAMDFLLDYLKEYDRKSYAQVKKIHQNKILTSAGWVARMLSRQCTLPEEAMKFFHRELAKYVEIGKAIKVEKKSNVELVSTKDSPTDLLIAEIEEFEDSFFIEPKKVLPFDPAAFFRTNNASQATIKAVQEFYTRRLEELESSKKDAQLKEAYSCFSTEEKNLIRKFYSKILSDADLVLNNKVRSRKPRAKKVHSANELVKNISFANMDPDTKIETMPAEKIIGQDVAILYNIKTRRLTIYEGSNLTVKGKTLLNYDKSYEKTLRKPVEMLPPFASVTKRTYMKKFDALSTKSAVPSGRLNNDQILLYVAK